VIVPAGYLSNATPYGISFTGGAYSEAKLISLAYSFEQASKVRQPPPAAQRVLPVSANVAPASIVNYATGASGAVAPGEMVAITGSGLGAAEPAGMTVSNGRVNPWAGTSRVLFDGVPAPIMSAQAGLIVAIVPYAVYGKATAQMAVEYNGFRSASMTVSIAASAPGIFTSKTMGQGSPMITNPDGTVNSATAPAPKGSYVTFTGTGEGILQTLAIDGRLAVASPYQTPYLPVAVSINGTETKPMYAGAAPNTAGIMQVNAALPADLPAGGVSMILSVGTASTPPVTVYVQ